MSAKTLEAKIQKLEEKVALLKEKNQKVNAALRRERSLRKEVASSRGLWRSRFKAMSNQGILLPNDSDCTKSSGIKKDKIAGHKYNTLIVSLCVNIYLLGNCGLRSTLRVISTLSAIIGIELGCLPSKSSIENWVKKIGYELYENPPWSDKVNSYGLIIDESMVIGQERLLIILGISSFKVHTEALCLNEVVILYMGVRKSWTGIDVKDAIQKVMEKEGKQAEYVISDKGSTMCKGILEAGLIRVADVGHEIARLTEKRYGNDELEVFLGEAKACKAKLVMTPMSYLLCPKQRKIARFMNLSTSMKWGKTTLDNFDKLTLKEQSNFEWLKKHQSIINELSDVFKLTERILKIIKNEGLSHKTIDYCLHICLQNAKQNSQNFKQLMIDIKAYLLTEKSKLPDAKTTWHASSDIIESLFGTFKARKASNPLHGVTSFILLLPLMTTANTQKELLNINVKEALENVKMADLQKWNDTYMTENQVVKRKKIFNL